MWLTCNSINLNFVTVYKFCTIDSQTLETVAVLYVENE